MQPSNVGHLDYKVLRLYTVSYKRRIEIVRRTFKHAKILLYGVVTDHAFSLESSDKSINHRRAMMRGLKIIAKFGLFDQVDYISPVIYYRKGLKDFLDLDAFQNVESIYKNRRERNKARKLYVSYLKRFSSLSINLAKKVVLASGKSNLKIMPLLTQMVSNRGPSLNINADHLGMSNKLTFKEFLDMTDQQIKEKIINYFASQDNPPRSLNRSDLIINIKGKYDPVVVAQTRKLSLVKNISRPLGVEWIF